MSYIKKLEEDYNNGKISLKIINEKRELYYKLSENEKEKIDKKYGSEPNKKNISKSFDESEEKNEIKDNIKYTFYFLTAFVCSIYSIIMELQRIYFIYLRVDDFLLKEVIANFFALFVWSLIIATPIHLLSQSIGWKSKNLKDTEFSKTLFWTTLILGLFFVYTCLTCFVTN